MFKIKTLNILIVFIIIINLFSYFIIKFKFKNSIYSKNYYSKKRNLYISDPVNKSLHPFFGFLEFDNVIDEKNDLTNEPLFSSIYVHKANKSEKYYKILILGSTLSKSFSISSSKNGNNAHIFEKIFKKKFKDINFKIYNASIRNSKQPQQLFKLYYLDLIGLKFDLIINIDGLTELVHPKTKNYTINDELIYPRRFSEEIWETQKDYSCIKKSNSFSSRYSIIPVLEFFDLTYIKLCNDKIRKKQDKDQYWKTKINQNILTEEQIISKSLEIWKRSSVKIFEYSIKNNSKYLHVVLPNLYDNGSKLLSKTELSFKNKGYEYQYIIEKYYKKLNITLIQNLHFLSLKNTFSKNNLTVYSDNCCNFNYYGLNYLSDKISDYIKINFLSN